MFSKFVPERSFAKLRDIQAEFLKREGIRLLMLDFDNTIMAYTEDREPFWWKKWISSLRREGIRVMVISNSHRSKAYAYCYDWDIPIVTKAGKPSPKALKWAVRLCHLPLEQCAMVGDQIFTDILAANLCHVHSYLVTPIHNHNFWLKARYKLQLFILRIAKRR